MKIYVGNLSWSATEEELRTAFEQHGDVASVSIVTDRETGRSRGFAFVEMENSGEANAAIEALNDTEVSGRPINVNEARPRGEGGRGGGGGFRGGQGGGGGGGGGGRRRENW